MIEFLAVLVWPLIVVISIIFLLGPDYPDIEDVTIERRHWLSNWITTTTTYTPKKKRRKKRRRG